MELSAEVKGSVERAVEVVLEQVEELRRLAFEEHRAEQAAEAGEPADARALARERDRPGDRAASRRGGGPCARCRCDSGGCARWYRIALLLLRDRLPRRRPDRRRRLDLELMDALLRCVVRPSEWDPLAVRARTRATCCCRRCSAAPPAARAAPRSSAARSSRSSRSWSRRPLRRRRLRNELSRGGGDASHQGSRSPRTRWTPTRRSPAANRADFDRATVRVVNLMSAPGAGKTTLLEAALPGLEPRGWGAGGRRPGQHGRGPDRRAARAGHAAQHGQRLRRGLPPGREHGPHGAAGPAARRDRPAGDRERRKPGLPGRVPDRRGRARRWSARSRRARTSRSSTR